MNYHSHYGKQSGGFFKILKIVLERWLSGRALRCMHKSLSSIPSIKKIFIYTYMYFMCMYTYILSTLVQIVEHIGF